MSSSYRPSLSEIAAVAQTRGADSDDPESWKGLRGLWSFRENGGRRLFDFSGFGEHGTPTNGPTWGADYLHFVPGSSQYIDVGMETEDNVYQNNALTVAAWVRNDNLAVDATVMGRLDIIGGVSDQQWLLWMDTGEGADGYALGIKTDSTTLKAGTTTASAIVNKWQHVAGTWDGLAVRVYVDGVQVASNVTAGTIRQEINTKIGIGVSTPKGPSRFWTGDIRQAAFWSRALAASEIAKLYYDSDAMFSLKTRVSVISPPGGFVRPLVSGSLADGRKGLVA